MNGQIQQSLKWIKYHQEINNTGLFFLFVEHLDQHYVSGNLGLKSKVLMALKVKVKYLKVQHIKKYLQN